MSIFKYTLPSGDNYIVNGPDGATQEQADRIFYEQVASGAVVGFAPGQSIEGQQETLRKFSLDRLDRGTAGVSETAVLAIIGQQTTVASVPDLKDVPIENPVDQATVALARTGLGPVAVGTLTPIQVQALQAQLAALVNQPADQISASKGIGKYGFFCLVLEEAGYIKPGTTARFLTPTNFVELMSSPLIWTGKNGVYSLEQLLSNEALQTQIQTEIMTNTVKKLEAAGLLQPPVTAAATAAVGEVYSNITPNQIAASNIQQSINADIGALILNGSVNGIKAVQEWSKGLNTNLTSIMDIQGKAAKYAMNLVQGKLGSLGNLSNLNLSNLGNLGGLGNLNLNSLSGLQNRLTGSLTNLGGNLQGQLGALQGQLTGAVQGQLGALQGQLTGAVQGQLGALQGQLTGALGNLNNLANFNNLSSLVSNVQSAAAFKGTVDRAVLDSAFTRVLGSAKIPTPSFSPPSLDSLGSQLDIKFAQNLFNNQVKGLANQAVSFSNTAVAGARNNLTQLASTATNRLQM